MRRKSASVMLRKMRRQVYLCVASTRLGYCENVAEDFSRYCKRHKPKRRSSVARPAARKPKARRK